jgi:hypothetical protein
VTLTVTEPFVAPPVATRVRSGRLVRTCRWVVVHRWALTTLVAVVAILAIRGRLPADGLLVGMFVFVLLVVDGLTVSGWRHTVGIARDWLPVFGIVVFYDTTRGFAEDLGMPLQVDALIEVEKLLAAGEVPSVWLQDRLLGQETAWWEPILTLTYMTHFVFSFALLGVLYVRSRDRWLGYVRRFVTLCLAGMLTYVLLPAAPPWWASEHGSLPPVSRSLSRGWDVIGLQTVGGVIKRGQAGVNEVAALPSLHAGFACLFVMVLWASASRARPLLAAYPLLMGFALVIGGEHYVIDLILGAIYAGVVHVGWTRWERRRSAASRSSDLGPMGAGGVDHRRDRPPPAGTVPCRGGPVYPDRPVG